MSSSVQANPAALIESVARTLPAGAQDDFRNLMGGVVLANLTALSPGGNLLQAGGAGTGASAPPAGVTFTAVGGSGVITVSITDPTTAKPNTIYHEVSYGPLVSFTQSVNTMAATTAATVSIPAPGQSYFVRLRSSFDKKTWSAYQLASTTAIDAGLVESGAMAPAAAFNQTNYGVVNSAASGSAAAVTISGTGGDLTSYPAVKGSVQVVRPSATIVGVPPESEQFVAWDGGPGTFVLKPTLASVFSNDLEPVGKVSVVSTAVPTLPTIVPIVSGGGVVGFNVTSGGAGASEPYTLAITGVGAGATAGAQTIVAGVLESVAPGNAGGGYVQASTAVVPSGGAGGGGTTGGGTALGGNGGRLSNV